MLVRSILPFGLFGLILVGSPPGMPPQEPAPRRILSEEETASLNRKGRAWFGARLERELAQGIAARRALQPVFAEAQGAFLSEWEDYEARGNILASVVDLRAIFENVFPYPEVAATDGVVEIPAAGEDPAYDLRLPQSYDPRSPYRQITLLTEIDEKQQTVVSAKEYFALTWKGAPLSTDSIFVFPRLSPEVPLDAMPAGVVGEQFARTSTLFRPLAAAQRDYHIDRERMILDCGKGSSAFGVWMATSFPHRFAGLILRWPADVSELRLGSMTGLPVLVITNAETRAAGLELARRLNELAEGACVLVDGVGRYPFPGSLREIESWLSGIRREPSPKRVVLEPNSDVFNDGYWVRIETAEPLAFLPRDEQPRLAVEADRVRNRIAVSARNVTDFELLLNDELVDLDRPITLVINGKDTQQTRNRSFETLIDGMFGRYDPTWIFTTSLRVAVPKR